MEVVLKEISFIGRVKKTGDFPTTSEDGLKKVTKGLRLASSTTVSWTPEPGCLRVRGIIVNESGKTIFNPYTGGQDQIYRGNQINTPHVQRLTRVRGRRGRTISPHFE